YGGAVGVRLLGRWRLPRGRHDGCGAHRRPVQPVRVAVERVSGQRNTAPFPFRVPPLETEVATGDPAPGEVVELVAVPDRLPSGVVPDGRSPRAADHPRLHTPGHDHRD